MLKLLKLLKNENTNDNGPKGEGNVQDTPEIRPENKGVQTSLITKASWGIAIPVIVVCATIIILAVIAAAIPVTIFFLIIGLIKFIINVRQANKRKIMFVETDEDKEDNIKLDPTKPWNQ